MARVENTVFISYRRADVYMALLVYKYLTDQGYDVFFDYTRLPSGDFEQNIIGNIKNRAHFLVILTPTALDRCNEPGDWLRREIETAIDEKRNIVPLFFKGFSFKNPSVSEKLTDKLKNLERNNGMNVYEEYFDPAMEKLIHQFLSVPQDTFLHPVSTEVQKVVKNEKDAANNAPTPQKKEIKEPVKPIEEKPLKQKRDQVNEPMNFPFPPRAELNGAKRRESEESARLAREKETKTEIPASYEESIPKPKIEEASEKPVQFPQKKNIILIVIIGTLIFFIGLCIFGGLYLVQGVFGSDPPTPTNNLFEGSPTLSSTDDVPTYTDVSPLPSTIPDLGIGNTMISPKDGMVLVHVPAGEFIMGIGTDEHLVSLDAFWIDQTEVTNAMYLKCVEDRECNSPDREDSSSRDSYFGNPEFENYPVIYVSWNDANSYCSWADRRLPTEAEWEKAASWDEEKQQKYAYPWGNAIDCSLANYSGCAGDTTVVGSYLDGQSHHNAYDMAGNVWEWVSSLFRPYPYDATDGREEFNASAVFVLRGGSWADDDEYARSVYRSWSDPTLSDRNVGFRCAIDASE